MIQIEWLVKTETKILDNPVVARIIKDLNEGCIKIIKKEEEEVLIALPINPENLNLPKEVKRERVKNDPSCWERWGL